MVNGLEHFLTTLRKGVISCFIVCGNVSNLVRLLVNMFVNKSPYSFLSLSHGIVVPFEIL